VRGDALQDVLVEVAVGIDHADPLSSLDVGQDHPGEEGALARAGLAADVDVLPAVGLRHPEVLDRVLV
jgi:hypothetical protein